MPLNMEKLKPQVENLAIFAAVKEVYGGRLDLLTPALARDWNAYLLERDDPALVARLGIKNLSEDGTCTCGSPCLLEDVEFAMLDDNPLDFSHAALIHLCLKCGERYRVPLDFYQSAERRKMDAL